MNEFMPYITADGSVGLYNSEFQDIYHSATGALSEAYDKFILPINFEILLSKDNIKILDICYGIGYNTKAFLNTIYKNYFSNEKLIKIFNKNNSQNFNNIAPIYTDNTKTKEPKILSVNNGPIYTNNILNRISITALDTNEILFGISPFIKSYVKNPQKINKKLIIDKNLNKYFVNKRKSAPKINNIINYFIYDKTLKALPDVYCNHNLLGILNNKSYKNIFNKSLNGIFHVFELEEHITEPKFKDYLNLHNIYYRYLSKRYKIALNTLKLNDITFKPVIGDARDYIKNDNNTYNIIFLDAFSPNKCPCLWSYEFFKALYDRLKDDGMLLTYSVSAPVRNAMIEAGFYIGNNIVEGKVIGTICTKNSHLIKQPLSEFDLGLLKTKAGIFYRDKNLTSQNEAIIALRNSEVNNSDKMSTTQYKKSFKKVK